MINNDDRIELSVTGRPQISNQDLHYRIVIRTGQEGMTSLKSIRDFRDRPLSPEAREKYAKLNRLQIAMRSRIERKRRYVVKLIRVVASQLGLNANVRDRAIALYLQASSKLNVTDRRHLVMLAAACTLIALRELRHEAPVTLQELMACFKELGLRARVMSIIELAHKVRSVLGERVLPRHSIDYLSRLVNDICHDDEFIERIRKANINLSLYAQELLIRSLKLVNEVKGRIGGRRPYVVAAAAIYAADKLIATKRSQKPLLTQRLLSRIAGVSECAIREAYAMLFRDIIRDHPLK
ncbi:MAG: hypothetical protein DRN15_06945 [Thermoprotei archaeon]|nr:MAG: hypothetical protein DRN15_06945 [Thermoprotei archaeon]RLF24143.1 MAG: hypothetical protein DRM97_03885 [Thermoprotei archaeon]